MFFPFVAEVQGETEHAGDIRDESVARSEAASDRGLGRRPSLTGLAPLRGTSSGHHHVRQGSVQVRDAGQAGRGGRLRLGLLREPVAHTLLGEVR